MTTNIEIYREFKRGKITSEMASIRISLNTANKIKTIFKDLFKHFYDEFVLYLEKSECFISGSFVLQNILDEKWNDSDIDIFTHSKLDTLLNWGNFDVSSDDEPIASKSPKKKQENIKKNTKKNYDNILIFLRDEVKCNMKTHNGNGYDNIAIQKKGDCHTDAIIDVIDVTINQTILQFISIKKDVDIKKSIHDFDFDICKNICGVKDWEFFVNIYNMQEIFEKKFNLKYNGHLKTIQRINKYIERGFKIFFDKEQVYKKLKFELEQEHKNCTDNYRDYCRDAKRLITIHETDLDLSDFYNQIYTMYYPYHTISRNQIKLHDIDDNIIKNIIIDSIVNNYDEKKKRNKITNQELCCKDCIFRILDKNHFHYSSSLQGEALEHIFVQKEKPICMIKINIDSNEKIEL